ncbi:uncharacterized protein LOC143059173 [Mytilus galloprovincialis]|uniref:uncharacterized protein LOC143059173 n=1 Tax=Mytilus galloprovincialis TaxID=29158 RepID=UPI003F7C4E2B
MLKDVIRKIKHRIEVIEKETDNLYFVSQGLIMFLTADQVHVFKQEIRKFKDYLRVIERRHNEDNKDLTYNPYISKDGRSVTMKENEDYMYVLEKRLQMIYAAFRSLRNWNLDGVFPNLTEKIKEGLDIIRHEIQITLTKYGRFSCRTVEESKKEIYSIENNLEKICYDCENFEVVKKAADEFNMIESWIEATNNKIDVIGIYGFYGLKEDDINIVKNKLEKMRYSCERIGYACKNAGVWKRVSVAVFMIQSWIEEMMHKIECNGKRTLNGISADINIIKSKLEKIWHASVGKKDADTFFGIQWQIGIIKDKIDVIWEKTLYGAYEVWEIQWKIESIKDQIDVIGKSSRDEYLRRKSEVGNSKHIRISGEGITPAVKALGLILIMFLLSELPKYLKKNQSFDGRLKIQKDICWSVDMSFMQFKNKQIWNAGQIIVHGKDENLQGNHMMMQPLVVKG